MSTEIDAILAELKELRKEIDRLKSFDVPRASGDFVRISGDTMTGPLGIGTTPVALLHVSGNATVINPIRITNTSVSPSKTWHITGNGNDFHIVETGVVVPFVIQAGGNVGVRTGTPTAAFSLSEKCAMNADGGFMVKLTNKTGGNSVKGEVVMAYDAGAVNNAVAKIVQNEPDPIGVFYESGVADGAEAWIVVAGIADVYFIGNTTRGHIARGFVTADAGYVTGQALSEAIPGSPFATDKHWFEIGHVLESRTGAGLAKCVLHFN